MSGKTLINRTQSIKGAGGNPREDHEKRELVWWIPLRNQPLDFISYSNFTVVTILRLQAIVNINIFSINF